ncbi:MAG: NmrA/HSCARG family protein [Ferruginibacter sp.]
MITKPIVLVTGATGAQGGSVAKALLNEARYTVRVLTRDRHSLKAKALEEAGAEICEGDFENPESLDIALKDCDAVFGVTNFWEHFENEYRQGKNLIDAVKKAQINHFVFHTLPDYNRLSQGKFQVPHCDLKARLQHYAASLGIPSTFIHVAFYFENFINFFPLQLEPDGKYYFGFPQGDTPLAMTSIEDLGPVVCSILKNPGAYIGRTVGLVAEDDPCEIYAETMSRVLGKEINYRYIPRDEYAALGFPGADELANMFEVQRLFIPERKKDKAESYFLNPAMQSFEQWLSLNKSKFDSMLNEVKDNSLPVQQ